MSQPNDDKLVDEHLRGGSHFSQLYRGIETDEVPPDIDATILNEARSAIVKRKGFTWRQATPVLAIAATAVLTVSIVLKSGLETDRTSRARILNVEVAQPAERAEPNVEQQSDAENERAAVAVEQRERQSHEQAAEKKSEAVPARVEAAPQATEMPKVIAPPKLDVPPLANAPAPANSPSAAGNVAASELQLPEQLEKPAAPQAALSSQAEVRSATRATAPPSTAAPSASRDLEVVAGAAPSNQQRSAAGMPAQAASEDRTRSRSARTAVYDQQAKAVAERRVDEKLREENPALWLEYIRELRGAGQHVNADREWARFAKAYPKYEVAADDLARPNR